MQRRSVVLWLAYPPRPFSVRGEGTSKVRNTCTRYTNATPHTSHPAILVSRSFTWQRAMVRLDGGAEAIPFDLRVTEVFRREGDEWKLVHRHADSLASQS